DHPPLSRPRPGHPPPPRDTAPDDRRWRRTRHHVGSTLFSRAHPSKFCFDAICFAIDDGQPRAWVASVDNCLWCALPRIVSHLFYGPKQDWMQVYQYIDLQHWRPQATALMLTMEISVRPRARREKRKNQA
ncbi:hypothetical protein BRADI_1g33506v3, partial [Brachypodium distachyon]